MGALEELRAHTYTLSPMCDGLHRGRASPYFLAAGLSASFPLYCALLERFSKEEWRRVVCLSRATPIGGCKRAGCETMSRVSSGPCVSSFESVILLQSEFVLYRVQLHHGHRITALYGWAV